MGANHYVEIVRYHDGGVEERMGPMSERKADKVDSGLNRQLNHRDFYTRIVSDAPGNRQCQS